MWCRQLAHLTALASALASSPLLSLCLVLSAGCTTVVPLSEADIGEDPEVIGFQITGGADPGEADVAGDAEGPGDAGPGPVAGGPPTPSDLVTVLLPGQVAAGVIESPTQLLTGPRAEGGLGDVKLYNAHAAFIIEAPGIAGGLRRWGGWPVDVARLSTSGAATADHYGEIFFVGDADALHPSLLEIIDDGRTSGEAHVRVTGSTDTFDAAPALVGPIADATPLDLGATLDYRLAGDAEALSITLTLHNPAALPRVIATPALVGHFGDQVWPWAPGLGYGVDVAAPGTPLPYLAAAGRDVAYTLVAEDDDLEVLDAGSHVLVARQPALEVPAGGSASLRWWLDVTSRGASGCDAARRDLLGDAEVPATVQGTVALPSTAAAATSRVVARRADGSVETSGPVRSDGFYTLTMRPGLYRLVAHDKGHLAAPPVPVELDAGAAETVPLQMPQSATVEVSVTDATTAEALPARVTFVRAAGTAAAAAPTDAIPRSLATSWHEDIAEAVALTTGPREVVLPPGDYEVFASRGFSYERATATVSLVAGPNPALAFTLARAVDTRGWLALDADIHGYRSPTSSVTYELRAGQAVAEALHVPVLSEEVFVASLGPAIVLAGLSDKAVGLAGHEAESLTFGAFGVFPQIWSPTQPSGGAVYALDKDPAALFAALRAQSPGDEIIQVAHPRDAARGGYFEWADVNLGASDVEGWLPDAVDAVEVFTGSCALAGPNDQALEDWIDLTNRGHTLALAGGSDVHDATPPGRVRTWVHLEHEDVIEDPDALVAAVRGRRQFVSCGPFVVVEPLDAKGEQTALGALLSVDTAGEVTLVVTVAAPTWIDVDEVRLWRNGVVVDVIDVSAPADPVVRFDDTITVAPTADAWYAVEVIGGDTLWPVGEGEPYALTNPIEVDADGDGAWTPPGVPER